MSKSKKEFNTNLLKKLPKEIGKDIFSYLIPDSNKIVFKLNQKHIKTTYSERYQIAYIDNQLVENQTGKYLCRITNLNGKHLYYIAEECVHLSKPENVEYPCIYISYVGKNIDLSLLQLFSEP